MPIYSKCKQLQSAFIGAKALINSRRLIYQNADPTDNVPLPPNHFLVGRLGGAYAPNVIAETSFNHIKCWRRLQELVKG